MQHDNLDWIQPQNNEFNWNYPQINDSSIYHNYEQDDRQFVIYTMLENSSISTDFTSQQASLENDEIQDLSTTLSSKADESIDDLESNFQPKFFNFLNYLTLFVRIRFTVGDFKYKQSRLLR